MRRVLASSLLRRPTTLAPHSCSSSSFRLPASSSFSSLRRPSLFSRRPFSSFSSSSSSSSSLSSSFRRFRLSASCAAVAFAAAGWSASWFKAEAVAAVTAAAPGVDGDELVKQPAQRWMAALTPQQRLQMEEAVVEAAALAGGGNATCQCDVGTLLVTFGQIQPAIHWFTLAANQGNAEANRSLGLLYLNGNQGLTADFEKAKTYLTFAADHNDPYARLVLGDQLVSGRRLARDVTRGVALIESVAGRATTMIGNEAQVLSEISQTKLRGWVSEAQFVLSRVYEGKNEHVPAQPAVAKRWLVQSAGNGYPHAQFECARRLLAAAAAPATATAPKSPEQRQRLRVEAMNYLKQLIMNPAVTGNVELAIGLGRPAALMWGIGVQRGWADATARDDGGEPTPEDVEILKQSAAKVVTQLRTAGFVLSQPLQQLINAQ